MRKRLDSEMVRRGFVETRTQAQSAIEAGLVTVQGRPATKSSMLIGLQEHVRLETSPHKFASRGGLKLEGALNRFAVDPTGMDCLDAGASTGGFTDCLLQKGAGRVIALDVGYGQLAWILRTDPRVVVLERTNVRDLSANVLPFAADLVVADLSFISLKLVIPALVGSAKEEAGFVVLVKPQFEAGKSKVEKGGVVRDPQVWETCIEEVCGAFATAGRKVLDVWPSPLAGPAGNIEFFVHAQGVWSQADAGADVGAAVEEGLRIKAKK